MKMMNRLRCLLAVFMVLFAPKLLAGGLEGSAPSLKVPTFSDYPAKASSSTYKYAGRILLATARARRYRTVIRSEGIKEPNFSAHYRIVTWGCGTDCHGLAIVDRLTGRVFTPKEFAYVAGAMGNDEPRLDFRVDSRLLVLTGLLDDDEEGKFFFEWTGKELRLLSRLPIFKESFAPE